MAQFGEDPDNLRHHGLCPVTLNSTSIAQMGINPEVPNWDKIDQASTKASSVNLIEEKIQAGTNTTLKVLIGKIEIECHMMLLQCYSTFFVQCEEVKMVILPEKIITPLAFQTIYDWMKASHFQLPREGLVDVLKAAEFLGIEELVEQCWYCFNDADHFREDTALLCYWEARNRGVKQLQDMMFQRVCRFFLSFVASAHFLELNADEVAEILSSNSIGINSEVEILMCAVRWLEKKWEEREKYTVKVMKSVRFKLMPSWFVAILHRDRDCFEVQSCIEHPDVMKMVDDALAYHSIMDAYNPNIDIELAEYMKGHKLEKPTQRTWIYDEKCKYHYRPKESPKTVQFITYCTFLQYLGFLQDAGQKHWQYVEYV